MKETGYSVSGLDPKGYAFAFFCLSEREARARYNVAKYNSKSIKLEKTTISHEILEENSAPAEEIGQSTVPDV